MRCSFRAEEVMHIFQTNLMNVNANVQYIQTHLLTHGLLFISSLMDSMEYEYSTSALNEGTA